LIGTVNLTNNRRQECLHTKKKEQIEDMNLSGVGVPLPHLISVDSILHGICALFYTARAQVD
jgi:hypothetical protein